MMDTSIKKDTDELCGIKLQCILTNRITSLSWLLAYSLQ